MQKTNFPFEVVVGEDCSVDKTKDIILDYEKRYPDTIKVLSSEKNVGAVQNSIRVQKTCRGKYHAFCEGDDYWIDPLKLQKQVDFMEIHPEYSMCFHDAFAAWEGKVGPPYYFCPSDLEERIRIADVLLRPWFIPTASILARAHVLNSLPEWRVNVWCGDLVMQLWCAHHGTLGYINEVMSVYRRQSAGLSMTIAMNPDVLFPAMRYVYREFDKETGYQHTTLIARAVTRTEDEYRFVKLRNRLGVLAFIFQPGRAITRLKKLTMLLWHISHNFGNFVSLVEGTADNMTKKPQAIRSM